MLQSLAQFVRRLPSCDSKVTVERQVGAIPYAVVQDRAAFLLITSRRTGRWIFPKGAVTDGFTERELAAREAFEEAGVVGTVEPDVAGAYRDWKTRNLMRYPIEVALYPLRVEQQLETWREAGQRYRHWAIFPEARKLLTNPGLVEMIARIDRRVRAGGPQSPVA
ncbi:MAG: NUDIX hydrolase [Alphaproteobacteria bacterium]